ncbi:MAG: RNA-binding protein [Altibacter sp.]|uniref:VCBS repeat-containing protein n=1 Tax=Altibacter sp. TaxID=2024823 RepID=UPI000C980F57|nr:VCBS repeat-containing protein [Altibacter sp.]MAP54772.1 RNA-binding protein [Altibacter sp.]
MNTKFFFSLFLLIIFSCSESPSEAKKDGTLTDGADTLFTKITEDQSGITFKNVITQTVDFNFMNYMYIYTGAGVAVGDIDNDGLEDIYFVSNFGPNKLYKNKGNFEFEDITVTAKAQDYSGFSTGVTMLDINNDGYLDIYVCKAGSLKDDDVRRNLLFINQKDGTFSEAAKTWGLDDPGYSTQAYPLDYDKDGDLDLYVVNHRYDFQNNGTISGDIQRQIEETTSDHLYRNDGNRFTKVTREAGLYNKAWGLSAVISDFNEDGWEDIYVANDFLEPDILYINRKDGTFKDEILSRFDHISTNSMGSDYADLNNDLYPDLITVDMLSENYARSKENMASMDTQSFLTMVDIGYHHAYMANTLQYNTGKGKFKETSQMSGVTKTDWSWAPLIADFDNDGHKDLFVTNGVDKDYTNQDVRKQLYAIMQSGKAMQLEEVLNMIPSERINNYIYKNNGDLTFSKRIEEWGLNDPGYSNGAAYADLDNDGDLDLITNNLYDPAGIYRNNANHNYLQVALTGPTTNPLGIGAKVILKQGNDAQIQEQYLTRGFESSVSKVLQFGLGDRPEITEVLVAWPDGKVSKVSDVKANQRIAISYTTATEESITFRSKDRLKKEVDPSSLGISYAHKENDFNDYSLQLLLPQKQSSKGTGIVTGDLNNDGLDDFFVGNAAGATAAMYLQNSDGTFTEANTALWKSEAKYEDANALFFDADTDGDLDLYVVSAGYELSENDPLLQDRLYTNDGKGNFKKTNALPKMLGSGKSIAAGDLDKDGDLDLFVGGNVVSKKYPMAPDSYLLENQNGTFKDITAANQDLKAIGMVSDALFTDYDSDGDLDLMVIGEWMGPTFFDNTNGRFIRSTNTSGLDTAEGWWFSISETDFDGDGDMDYMLGNIGKNNKFQPKKDKPIYIYGKDFDNNGSFDVALSKINDGRLVPVRGKQCSSEQNPFLLEKIQTFKEFASLEMKDIYGEDRLKDAYKLVAHVFESMYAENLGNGVFKLHKLPNEAQLGPTMAFLPKDYNGDGNMDVMGIGAIYDAEVETIRYDSNYGYVLLGDGKGGFSYSEAYDPYIHWDAKDMTVISIKGVPHYMVVSNNAPLKIFTF